jgi:RecB family exonuclease
MGSAEGQLRFVRAGELLDELRAAVRRAKGDDPFAPVWVWSPHARASQALFQRMARADGLLNVTFMTERDVVFALLGVEGLELPRLGSAMQRELARQVLRGAKHPLEHHEQSNVVDAFVYALKELRTRPQPELDLIAESDDPLARELIRLYDVYRERVHKTYYDNQDLHALAVALQVEHPPVVSVITEPPEWYSNDLLQKVMKQKGSATIAVEAGRRDLDDTLHVWLWGVERTASLFDNAVHEHVSETERIVVAPDAAAEIDLAIATVLETAESGVPFSEMALLFPEPSPHWALAVSRLRSAGIPFRGRVPGSLAQTSLARFLVQTVEVIDSEFAFDAVAQWLSEPCLTNPLTGVRPDLGDWLDVARRARVTSGATEIADRLGRYAATLTRDSDVRMRDAAHGCAALVADLFATIGELPKTWFDWASLLQRCVERYVGTNETRKLWPRGEQIVAGSIEERLKKLEALDAIADKTVDTQSVVDALSAALDRSLPGSGDNRGILIGSFTDAVCAQFQHVVLCGLNEGLIPSAETRGALQVALRVPGQEKIAERQERAFLHALASSPNRTLLCARTDQRAQRERLPSPLLLQRASLLAGRHVGGTDLTEEREEWPWLTVVPSFSAFLVRDALFGLDAYVELSSMASWFGNGRAIAEHPVLSMRTNVQRSISVVEARDSSSLTRFDGRVGAQSSLLQPLRRPLTATRFEAWATCPARYYYSSVLELFSREDDDKQLGLSGRARGTAVHDVLERFVAAVPKRDRATQGWTDDERALLHTFGDEVYDDSIKQGTSQAGLLHNIERARLHDELDRFLAFDVEVREKYGVIIDGAEVSFGEGATLPAVVVQRPNGKQPVHFRGRIDRVDRSVDGDSATVIDYKTGKRTYLTFPKSDPTTAHGQKVQLAIYAEAAGANTALYWSTTEPGRNPFVDVAFDSKARERLTEVVDAVATGIEEGLFVAIPGKEDRDSYENCRMCAFDDICVSDRDEAWDRKMHDEAVKPWLVLHDD